MRPLSRGAVIDWCRFGRPLLDGSSNRVDASTDLEECGKVLRINDNWEAGDVCDATAHLKCTTLSRREKERLKGGLRSWSCCNLSATTTMPNSGLLHPLHQPAIKSFATPVTFQSLLTFTSSVSHRLIKKSGPRETSTTSGQSRQLACT